MSSKIGWVLLLLVLLHVLNVFGIAKMRHRALTRAGQDFSEPDPLAESKGFEPEQFLRRLEVSSRFDSEGQDRLTSPPNNTRV